MNADPKDSDIDDTPEYPLPSPTDSLSRDQRPPDDDDTGVEQVPTDDDTGVEQVPTDDDTGVEQVPTDDDTGVEQVPTDDVKRGDVEAHPDDPDITGDDLSGEPS
ncbi:hypothetical protein [Pseudomonas sp. Irchel s3b2]|uniref:hypothetical protein n=1 Tax=Pseudomonas sp. Irchel s3b2 TaxID=2009073 RepID=UPI000BA3336D|nr:hypothetical protein [Pseudomonas sp. Irchel s3b2]